MAQAAAKLPPPSTAIVKRQPLPIHIIPVRTDTLSGGSGVRWDSLLDGLVGSSCGWSGGGWSNPVTGLGTFGRDKVMQGSYSEPYRIDDPQLSALYNGNDLAQRIVTTKPREMMRRGWCLVVPQDDDDVADEQEVAAAASDKEGAGTMEQLPSGESGPAAPGSPLVDPMGAPAENATSNDPNDQGAPKDYSMSAPAQPEVSPAAAGAASDDPMGENLQKPVGPDRNAIRARDNKKTAPPGADKSDQNKGADLALAAETYAARLQLKARVLEAMIFGRLYGGGLLIVGADDGEDMALPLDETKISSIRYLAWIDRRFVFASSWYANIGPKYGEVQTWQIVNPFGGQSNTHVHESRVIRFDGTPVDFLMRRRLLGWTLSVLQAPYDVMRQFDQSFQSVANLMADISQAVMKINGLAQLISNDQQTLQTRMQLVDMSRSSSRMIYLDAENEAFERTATPLTGVSDTIQMQMLRMSAACEIPVAILFGREPSGLNATGDADFRRFYDTIAGEQLTVLEPKLRRLYTLIFAAKDGPTGGKVPGRGVEFTWHKLYEPSELEQSTIRWNMAQADDKYIANGTLLPEEVALSRFRSGDLHLDTEIETELRDESLKNAELAPSGAEKAEQDQQNKEAELKIQATSASAKAKPPGAGGPPKPPARGDDTRTDAWDEARYDAAADDVHETMLEDFPEEAISWVHAIPWRGPVKIPLSQIDFSNRAKWQASQPGEDTERVGKFQANLEEGEDNKPIIVVQPPTGKAIIVDGHHRGLAAWRHKGGTVLAYVGKTPKRVGPWDKTHDMQRAGKSGNARRSGAVK